MLLLVEVNNFQWSVLMSLKAMPLSHIGLCITIGNEGKIKRGKRDSPPPPHYREIRQGV